jgi:hypothetical protein
VHDLSLTRLSVSTGYGQPSCSQFDYVLAAGEHPGPEQFEIPSDLKVRLAIERFSSSVSEKLFRGPIDLKNDFLIKDRYLMQERLRFEATKIREKHSSTMNGKHILYPQKLPPWTR